MDALELMNPKQLAADFEVHDLGYDHPALGSDERHQPLLASQDHGRLTGMGEQSEWPGVEQHNGTHQEIPLSSGGNSFRCEVRSASRA